MARIARARATADLALIELKVDPSTVLNLVTPDGHKIPLVLDLSRDQKILIGNLVPADHSLATPCDPNLHLEKLALYSQVLDPQCKIPREPNTGWMGTRAKMSDIGETNKDVPDVVKVVSFDHTHPLGADSRQGLARQVCYLTTN